jgi:hypothetical protein
VTEPGMVFNQGLDDVVEEAMGQMSTPMQTFGEGAVDRAATEAELSDADVAAPTVYEDSAGQSLVRTAGSRTFRWVEGIWIDTNFDTNIETTRVPFLSDAYFELAGADPELGAALALGQSVIVVYADAAYEIVGAEESGDPVEMPVILSQEEEPQVDSPTIIMPQQSDPWGWIGGGLVALSAAGAALLIWKNRR